jgi:hypothetical protein
MQEGAPLIKKLLFHTLNYETAIARSASDAAIFLVKPKNKIASDALAMTNIGEFGVS